MTAPLLTISEQKKSLSGKKKQKRVLKNVLGLPSNLTVEARVVGEKDLIKLNEVLERLLPAARLPNLGNSKFNRNSEFKEITSIEFNNVKEARKKRNQLSIGVNKVNKSIKKGLIAAVLLANDIQPRFLIHHLNLLCHHNKIPFLHVPKLRDVINNCLGFPCIAIGFKNDSCDFLDAIEAVKGISETLNVLPNYGNKESLLQSGESENEEESDAEECQKNKGQSDVTPFKFLYRSSTKERMFIPETNESSTKILEKPKTDFISVSNGDDEIEMKMKLPKLGISSNLLRKSENLIKQIDNKDSDPSSTDNEQEDLEMPKRKVKKDWVIDKIGEKQKFKYHVANVHKIHSNPSRSKKRKSNIF